MLILSQVSVAFKHSLPDRSVVPPRFTRLRHSYFCHFSPWPTLRPMRPVLPEREAVGLARVRSARTSFLKPRRQRIILHIICLLRQLFFEWNDEAYWANRSADHVAQAESTPGAGGYPGHTEFRSAKGIGCPATTARQEPKVCLPGGGS